MGKQIDRNERDGSLISFPCGVPIKVNFFPGTSFRSALKRSYSKRIRSAPPTHTRSWSGGSFPFTNPNIFCRSGGTSVKLCSIALRSSTRSDPAMSNVNALLAHVNVKWNHFSFSPVSACVTWSTSRQGVRIGPCMYSHCPPLSKQLQWYLYHLHPQS